MTTHNEPTFELCPHDRENPYKQISRALIQDRTISPKAKGVLIYLLSLPKDWKINHSHLQYGLNIGEDYLNSAMDELIKAGYADRTRERIKGIFQPYRYKIREFKKCSPNRENRPGSTGPENPDIQNIETTSTEETTTATPKPAAVFSEKTPQKTKPNVYPILDLVDIPIHDKEEITQTYAEPCVIHAVGWATHPQTELTKGLVQAIKWASRVMPTMPQFAGDKEKKNKAYAMKYDGLRHGSDKIDALNTYVVINVQGAGDSPAFSYDIPKFMDKFKKALQKRGYVILDES